jgi:hypothetical protein
MCAPLSCDLAGFGRGTRYADLQIAQKDLAQKIESSALAAEKLQLQEKKRAIEQELASLENEKTLK